MGSKNNENYLKARGCPRAFSLSPAPGHKPFNFEHAEKPTDFRGRRSVEEANTAAMNEARDGAAFVVWRLRASRRERRGNPNSHLAGGIEHFEEELLHKPGNHVSSIFRAQEPFLSSEGRLRNQSDRRVTRAMPRCLPLAC